MNNKKIELDPKESKPLDGTEQQANAIVDTAKKTSKKRTGRGRSSSRDEKRLRRSNEEIEQEKLEKQMAEQAEALMAASFAALISVVTTQLSYLTDDKKWQSREDEEKGLTACVLGYCDMKFPNWRTGSPEAFLAAGIFGYAMPRFAIVEKTPIKDNPYKGWFTKIYNKFFKAEAKKDK